MENKMKELGFAIAPEGQKFPFGEYHPYMKRDRENPAHFHNTAFISEVLHTPEWQALNLPLEDNIELVTNLPYIASLGIILALNRTDGSWEAFASSLMLIVPDTLTAQQCEKLLKEKARLKHIFDNGIIDIRVISKNKETVDRLSDIDLYYTNYVEKLEETKTKSK